jgi:hypothetical protein
LGSEKRILDAALGDHLTASKEGNCIQARRRPA